MASDYPDISSILAAKARRRRELAALPWEEKIAIVKRMQRLLPKNCWRRGSSDGSAPPPERGSPPPDGPPAPPE